MVLVWHVVTRSSLLFTLTLTSTQTLLDSIQQRLERDWQGRGNLAPAKQKHKCKSISDLSFNGLISCTHAETSDGMGMVPEPIRVIMQNQWVGGAPSHCRSQSSLHGTALTT
eukprot:6147216-Amphidinium_carterae.1